jgi:hypothetical protein
MFNSGGKRRSPQYVTRRRSNWNRCSSVACGTMSVEDRVRVQPVLSWLQCRSDPRPYR